MRFTSIVAAWLLAASPVLAQFEDEFDDEFEDEPAPAPSRPAVASDDDANEDDEFDDPFGDDDFDALDDDDSNADADADDDADDVDDADADSEDSEEPDVDPRDLPDDARRMRMFNTWLGPTGGLHLMDAYNAPAGTFRVQLGIEFFAKSGFLFEGDDHSRVGGTVSLSWGLHDLVEVYTSLESYANSNNAEFPDLLIVLGDVVLGTKVGGAITDVFSIGGDFRFNLPTGSGLGVAFDGLGVGLGVNATADLRGLESNTPFLARFNLGYTFDRSERLIRSTENERYDLLLDPIAREDETRHLVTRVERYALSINRTDFFRIGVGIEAPIEIREDLHISPLLEWRMDIPVNRQGYDCPFVPAVPGGDDPIPGDDDCLDRVGVASFPSSLSFGVRLLPPVRGLGAWLGLDIGLTGRSRGNAVRELAQNEPWRLLIGLSYAHDARAPKVPPPILREREVPVEVPGDPPIRGRVIGRVVERTDDDTRPVPNAIIDFMSHDATSLMADDQGRFTTYAFEPGRVELSVGGDGMHPAPCEAEIDEEGNDVEVVCELERQLVAVEEEQVVILEQIQFAFDSDEILSASFGLMQQIADALTQNPQIRVVEIQGHTDDQGTYEYNENLSQRRANSVQRWLVEHGIEQARLRARGYGESRPLVNDTTEEARSRNRRVEFRIMERTE